MKSRRRALFRDVSCYSFDNYRRELASDLTLTDLQRFTERFLAKHRRQVQRKEPFLEFLVPEVLSPFKLPERYRTATFDREQAIRRTDADFFALGHPFVDAMLEYVGSCDFGGLTAIRVVKEPKYAGRAGFLFVFVVRERLTREDGDEYLFQLAPVFVWANGQVDDEAIMPALNLESSDDTADSQVTDAESTYLLARKHVEERFDIWDWDEAVEFLGLSRVQFR